MGNATVKDQLWYQENDSFVSVGRAGHVLTVFGLEGEPYLRQALVCRTCDGADGAPSQRQRWKVLTLGRVQNIASSHVVAAPAGLLRWPHMKPPPVRGDDAGGRWALEPVRADEQGLAPAGKECSTFRITNLGDTRYCLAVDPAGLGVVYARVVCHVSSEDEDA
jgi:hypothetical protein